MLDAQETTLLTNLLSEIENNLNLSVRIDNMEHRT